MLKGWLKTGVKSIAVVEPKPSAQLRKLAKAYGHDLTITTKDGKQWALGDIAEHLAEGMRALARRS